MLAPKDVEKLLKECEECDFEYMKKKIKKQQQLLEQKDNKINKLKTEMQKDKMEQFDDYVIYLIESYLEILEE